MNRRAALILCAVLAAAGCRRATNLPDANYQQASGLYQQLYVSQLDDAYGDPKMDEVVSLLQKVDPASLDAEAAAAKIGAIQHGREELGKSRAAREKKFATAQAAAVAPPVEIDPRKILAQNAPDAGPVQDPYGPGASLSEINSGTGGCLSGYEPFHENGTGVSGTVYRLVPGAGCAGKLPGYVGQAVLVVDGRIYRRLADPNPSIVAPPPPPAPVDAGPPPRTQAPARPPASPAAAPADAGEPEYQTVIPGLPQPGATPPPAEPPR